MNLNAIFRSLSMDDPIFFLSYVYMYVNMYVMMELAHINTRTLTGDGRTSPVKLRCFHMCEHVYVNPIFRSLRRSPIS